MAGVRGIGDHLFSQQRTVKEHTMKSAELRAMAVRLDVLRDIMVELVSSLPPDRAAGFAAALGDLLAGRMRDMEVDEHTDEAMVSDVAPVFAALRQRTISSQDSRCGLHKTGR
jgi:hypothetical protein